jgi:hypothetical protein
MDTTVPISPLPVRVARDALVRSLPTLGHAVDLYEAVGEALGDQVFHDPDGGDVTRKIYPRDSDGWLVPHCPLELSFAGRGVLPVQVLGGGELVPPRAPEVPKLIPRRHARPGHIRLDDGEGHFEIAYNTHGVKFETSSSGGGLVDRRDWEDLPYRIDPTARPPTPRPLSLLCHPDLPPEGVGLATLTAWTAALDPRTRVPARVWLEVPRPGGPEGVLAVGLAGLRRVFFEQPPPPDARWVVVDGVAGTAIGYGATPDEAHAAWQHAVWRVKPRAPEPKPATPVPLVPEQPPSETKNPDGSTTFHLGTIVLSGRGSALDPPVDTPDTLPAVRLPLPPLDFTVPAAFRAVGFERRVVLVGGRGRLGTALLRPEGSGYVLVGQDVVDRIDPTTLLAELDRAEARFPTQDPFATGHGPRWGQRTFMVDPAGALRVTQASHGGAVSPGELNGDALCGQVLRVQGPA